MQKSEQQKVELGFKSSQEHHEKENFNVILMRIVEVVSTSFAVFLLLSSKFIPSLSMLFKFSAFSIVSLEQKAAKTDLKMFWSSAD